MILTIVLSCKVNKSKNLSGIYIHKSKVGYGKLLLEDSTFNFEYEAPLLNQKSAGNLKRFDNFIILNSDKKYKTNYFIVEEKVAQELGYIQILDMNSEPLESVFVVVNNNQNDAQKTNAFGKILLNKSLKSIDNIRIDYLGLNNNVYVPKDYKSNVFIIKIEPEDYGKRFFENDTLKVNRGEFSIGRQKYIRK